MSSAHNQINYIELPANNLGGTKRFYSDLFNWKFTDYGPEYSAFEGAGLAGGFYKADLKSNSSNGAALVVLYSTNLEASQALIESAGGEIKVPIFSFPGGRRFHFLDPNGNELAVWSDQE
ncbi:VOC family protein [Neptuniibacter sp. QD48_11]|uniref:VOC family protein n=1 Tax=unclassified Neptuniibacter TaxID=2630693 RepID=UPI0039F628BA